MKNTFPSLIFIILFFTVQLYSAESSGEAGNRCTARPRL